MKLPIARRITILNRCAAAYRADHTDFSDITAKHHIYFQVIVYNPGITQDAISKKIYINKSNVTRVVTYLEKHGYVTRAVCPDDRRSTQVYPTDKMIAAFPAIQNAFAGWNKYMTENIQEEDLKIFDRVLNELVQRADNYMADRSDGAK